MSDEEGRVAGIGTRARRCCGRLRALLGTGARLAVEVLADDALQPRGRPVGRELDRLEPDRARQLCDRGDACTLVERTVACRAEECREAAACRAAERADVGRVDA